MLHYKLPNCTCDWIPGVLPWDLSYCSSCSMVPSLQRYHCFMYKQMEMSRVDSTLVSLESYSGWDIIGAHKSIMSAVELHQNYGLRQTPGWLVWDTQCCHKSGGVHRFVDGTLKMLGWGTGFKEVVNSEVFRGALREQCLFLLHSTKICAILINRNKIIIIIGIKSVVVCAESSFCLFLHMGQELIPPVSSASFSPL